MNKNLVSILMPVYNSYGHVRSEGKNLIQIAIDSLLAQSYTNFELIILDNQSIDNTPIVCQKYAEKDKRIRYIRDVKKRFPEGAITHLASFARGKYCMIANDDDVWEEKYIETLIKEMQNNDSVDLCYGNGHFINLEGKKVSRFVETESQSYNLVDDPVVTSLRYLHARNVIPIAFGLYKTKSFQETLPFKKFDDLKANVDNLFMFKFMVSGHKIKFINNDLFSYRVKTRALDPSKVIGMPDLNHPLEIWYYYAVHQFTFCRELIKLVDKYRKDSDTQTYLKVHAVISCLENSINLLSWIARDVAKRDKDIQHLNSFINLLSTDVPYTSNNGVNRSHILKDSVLLQSDTRIIVGKITRLTEIINSTKKKSIRPDLELTLAKYLHEYRTYLNEVANDLSAKGKRIKIKLSKKISQAVTQPKVSVIITSYNLRPFLKDTLYSALNQSGDDFEIVIIDGDSKDGSLKIIKNIAANYKNVRYISEPDSGYPEAFWKGLRIARGKYIAQCAVSDAYAYPKWLSICANLLDRDNTISLVWGFPRSINEKGYIGEISYPQFQGKFAPERKEYFTYWLKTGFFAPEGNLCVRKDVILKCYPKVAELDIHTLDWLEFNYRLNKNGYLTAHIPLIANYGRTHETQMSNSLTRAGQFAEMGRAYQKKVSKYMWELILGLRKHYFRDGRGEVLNSISHSDPAIMKLRQTVIRRQIKVAMDYVYSHVIQSWRL